ncbi:MAG: CBS domain-containing protein [Alphaproteobacteria bacterium]
MTVATILKTKGSAVHTMEAGRTLADAAKILSERKVGAVVVVEGKGKIQGILSERDIVLAIAGHGPGALTRSVADYMTTTIVSCVRTDSLEHLMTLMTDRRIRHLPVIESGKLLGIVSIGDVVKRRIADTEFEANSMREYIAHA